MPHLTGSLLGGERVSSVPRPRSWWMSKVEARGGRGKRHLSPVEKAGVHPGVAWG